MKLSGLNLSRRRFLGGVSLAAAGTAGYAHFVEAERLQVSRVSVPLENRGRSPLKLLHLSDLHASPVVSLHYLSAAIDRGLALNPDVICVTGDFITATCDHADAYAQVLRRLAGAAPCFASLGNHDGGAWAAEYGGYPDVEWALRLLADGGLTSLHNRASTFAVRDWELDFVGVGDVWSGCCQPAGAFESTRPGRQTILLSHNPDSKTELREYPWNLMLCGHTHGGQLRLPLVGTPFAPVRDKRFVAGLHRWENRWLHVTRGVGNIYGMRINCPPEISLLTLT